MSTGWRGIRVVLREERGATGRRGVAAQQSRDRLTDTVTAWPTLGVRGARAEGLVRVEQEIRRAQAEALGHAGERLDAVLAELARLDRRLDLLALHGAAADDGVVAETARRNRLRDRAATLAYHLIVQREALGIVRHAALHECYPIPSRRSPPGQTGALG